MATAIIYRDYRRRQQRINTSSSDTIKPTQSTPPAPGSLPVRYYSCCWVYFKCSISIMLEHPVTAATVDVTTPDLLCDSLQRDVSRPKKCPQAKAVNDTTHATTPPPARPSCLGSKVRNSSDSTGETKHTAVHLCALVWQGNMKSIQNDSCRRLHHTPL